MRTLLLLIVISTPTFAGTTRLKELIDIQGSRENALIGYGLVVGLTNTGDTEQVLFTMQSVAGMLGRLGVRVDPEVVNVLGMHGLSRTGSRSCCLVKGACWASVFELQHRRQFDTSRPLDLDLIAHFALDQASRER